MSVDASSLMKNPRRAAAGRLGGLLRGPLTAETHQRWRKAVLRNRPWERSTGPRTKAGKARSAANGRWRQRGEMSVRQLRGEMAGVWNMIGEMAAMRKSLEVLSQENPS